MTPDQEDARPVDLTPKRWQCCHCGGTGVDSHGETCPHCEGLGFC
ncbi:hypothetical protein [Microtetraspora glauca]|uniref:Rubrerythrin-like domain-containing protein n=1 Tax=Microtetraspora glauca TaxID=1996 RepID=A0ABV3GIB3_MICGL